MNTKRNDGQWAWIIFKSRSKNNQSIPENNYFKKLNNQGSGH